MSVKFTQLKDRKFLNDICQPWLHSYTKNVQLGKLYITSETVLNKEGKQKERGRFRVNIEEKKTTVPSAQVPMPANIKGSLPVMQNPTTGGTGNRLVQKTADAA
jgi:hypothetical protein